VSDGTDVAGWFDEDELETCPACGKKKLVPLQTWGQPPA
jgi:hypothetical protein